MPALALPDPPLSDAVIALRGFDSRDVAAVTAACQDPEIPRWTLVPRPYGENDAREHMRHMEAGRQTGTRLWLAIVDAADSDVLLGSIALNPIDREQRAADVGYWVVAGARGRGVATRAVRLVTGWALESLGLERVELRAQRANVASQAVAARAGFGPIDAPRIHRPECDHLPDVFFARLRGDA